MPILTSSSSQRGGALTVIVIILVVLALIVGGLFMLGKWGMGIVAEQVKNDIRDNPVIQQYIGEIQEIEIDLTASGAAEGDETFVFDLTGSKGSGQLTATVVTVDDEHEKVTKGSLRMPDGSTHDLFP